MTDRSDPPAARAARRYVEVATSDGKGDLADLFSADADFLTPVGTALHGREEIRAFYTAHLANITPTFHISAMLASDEACWVELAFGEYVLSH